MCKTESFEKCLLYNNKSGYKKYIIDWKTFNLFTRSISVRLGLFICRLLGSCSMSSSRIAEDFGKPYDTLLSWDSRACKPLHHNKMQFLRGDKWRGTISMQPDAQHSAVSFVACLRRAPTALIRIYPCLQSERFTPKVLVGRHKISVLK